MKKNFALRLINDMVLNPYNEDELKETERKIKIIRDNQQYTGISNMPKVSEQLKYISDSMLIYSKDDESTLGNLLSGLITNRDLLDIQIEKVRAEYKKEGEHLKDLINTPQK